MPFFAVQYTYRPAKAALRDQHRPLHREWLGEENSQSLLGGPAIETLVRGDGYAGARRLFK